MEHVFIIVEGASDVIILQQILLLLLPADTYQLHFYPAGGYYNALSSVRPILDLVPDGSKVLMVFDSDTSNPDKVQERIDYVKEYIGSDSYSSHFDVYTFVPTIDAVIPEGVELSMIKRTQREDYNSRIIDAVTRHIEEIRKIETISRIVEFIRQ